MCDFRGNFEALRSPQSTGYINNDLPDSTRRTPGQIRDDSALFNESENRLRTPRSKGLRRPESFRFVFYHPVVVALM